MPKSYEAQLDEMITPMRGVGRRSVLVTDEEYAVHMKNKAVAKGGNLTAMAEPKKESVTATAKKASSTAMAEPKKESVTATAKKASSTAGAKKNRKAASQTPTKSQKDASKSLAHPTPKTGGKPLMFMN